MQERLRVSKCKIHEHHTFFVELVLERLKGFQLICLLEEPYEVSSRPLKAIIRSPSIWPYVYSLPTQWNSIGYILQHMPPLCQVDSRQDIRSLSGIVKNRK